MDKPRATNLTVYALSSVAAILSTWPQYEALNIGLAMIFGLLILAYIVRSQAKPDDLVHHHMTFLIRTFWIYSLLASIGMALAGYLIYQNGDHSSFYALMDQINNGVIPEMGDMDRLEQTYLSANQTLIIDSFITCLFPALLYLVWRLTCGATRAYRNYRVQNIYSWI